MFKPTRLELEILNAVNEYELGTPSEVADHLGKDRSTISKLIKHLITAGQLKLIPARYKRIR